MIFPSHPRPSRLLHLFAYFTLLTGCQVLPPEDEGRTITPWTAYEAEDGKTNAGVHGPSREYLTPEAEASGRKFTRLDSEGEFLEIRVKHPANALVVRFCIPDAGNGGGIDATLGLFINGRFERKLHFSSRHAWIYGDFPWSNHPGQGKAHHFFDEARTLIPRVSTGDIIRLQKGTSDTAAYYLIDLLELEQVTDPQDQPPGSLSITPFGAVANDAGDDSAALMKCLETARAKGKTVWIPPGEFLLNGPRISLGNVRVQGAGMWHSTLTGKCPQFEGTGETVEFSDIAISGNIDCRRDEFPDNAFNGNFGRGSKFENLWIEHVKCGFWTTHGTDRMRVSGCRIRNTMADGLNFCDSTSRSVVENCHLRNTGDDALATWSPSGDWSSKTPCVGNSFIRNSIQLPWHASGIALYGGSDHRIAGNKIEGTVYSGAGILVSSGFGAIPFAGRIRLEGNQITGAGGNCYIGETVGGLWIHAKDSDIRAPISVSGLQITDSPNSAITIHGPERTEDLRFKNLVVRGTGEYGIEIKSDAAGILRTSGFEISGRRLAAIRNKAPENFRILLEGSRK